MRTHIRSEDKTPRSSLRLSLALVAVSVLALFVVAPAVAQPVNDDFDNATVVGALPFSDSISAADATAAPDDPGCIGSDDHTAWYSFTPTSDVRISADTTGSDYSPTLSVYTGSRGALTQIACNFGDTGVAFEAAAGTTYYFMVGSCCGSAGGNLVFNLSEAPTVTSLTVDHVNPVTKPGIVTISGTVACSTPTVLYAFEVDLEQVFAGRLRRQWIRPRQLRRLLSHREPLAVLFRLADIRTIWSRQSHGTGLRLPLHQRSVLHDVDHVDRHLAPCLANRTACQGPAGINRAAAGALHGPRRIAENVVMAVDPFDTGVVTVMFTDVEGSTDLTRRLGDEAARRTIENHRRIVRETLAAHDGREIDSIGDGFMLTFLSTRRAIACAIAIQKALAEHAREHPEEEVKLRIGLNVGEVLERGGHPFGAAVNATQRVGAHAKGGADLRQRAGPPPRGHDPRRQFSDRGRFALKGFPERWRLFEVVWAPPGSVRPS